MPFNRNNIANKYRAFDIMVNVIIPLLIGYACYFPFFRNHLNHLLNNYIPDCTWAYAFQSAILIIWERKIKIEWTIIIICSGLCFEILQYLHFFTGTGDIFDFLTYTISVLLALILNNTFSSIFKLNKSYDKKI